MYRGLPYDSTLTPSDSLVVQLPADVPSAERQAGGSSQWPEFMERCRRALRLMLYLEPITALPPQPALSPSPSPSQHTPSRAPSPGQTPPTPLRALPSRPPSPATPLPLPTRFAEPNSQTTEPALAAGQMASKHLVDVEILDRVG